MVSASTSTKISTTSNATKSDEEIGETRAISTYTPTNSRIFTKYIRIFKISVGETSWTSLVNKVFTKK